MAMKDSYIKKFGSKMLVASKSINGIPQEYLKQAFNCRSTGAGIIPRKGKVLLTNSTLGTNNKGGFVLNDTLYQITNSKIFSINLDTGVQTEIVTLGHDVRTDVLVYGDNFAIIASEGEVLKVFDGTATLITPTTIPVGDTGGILEFINSNEGYVLYAIGNILYISRPITPGNEAFAYDFTNAAAQSITYKSKIVSVKIGISGVFIFTENGNVEFIGSNSLQDIAGSPTFISRSLGVGGAPVSNRSVTVSGDQVFYITKNRKWNTVNYLPGTDRTAIGELSSVPIVGIDELLKGIDDIQPSGESFYNENDKTIQAHVRTNNFAFNNITLVYDLINKTFAVDTGKKYNYMVKFGSDYFGFSDLNSNIYQDDTGFSDAGSAIPFKIRTQAMNYGSIRQKLFGGILTAGGIGLQTALNYRVFIDKQSVTSRIIAGNTLGIGSLGEIGGESIGGEPIGGELEYISELQPFERVGDQGVIYEGGTRAEIEITSISQIQDFIIDMLGLMVEQTPHVDISNKW